MKLVTTIQKWIGDSGDAKPREDVAAGSEFYEEDTGDYYEFNGYTWEIKTAGIKPTVDLFARDLLCQILQQLKMHTIHLASISDEDVSEQDVSES